MDGIKVVNIEPSDSMRVIVEKLNRILNVVQDGVSVKVVERFEPELGQNLFTLSQPYKVGQNLLDVYVNGNKLAVGEDYEERSSTEVYLVEPTGDNDEVLFEWIIPNGENIVGRVDFSSVESLPDGSIPYSKLRLPNEIISGDIDGGVFTDPRFAAGIDGGAFNNPDEPSIDGGAL